MHRISLAIGAALALAACSSDVEQVENSIREELANQGTVEEVAMNEQSDGNMTGYAVVNVKNGWKTRMACNAHPQKNPDGTDLAWKCTPVIDSGAESQMNETIKKELATKGEVLEVAMKRKDDDDHMAGTARVKTADGAEHVLNCQAARQKADGQLLWSCDEVAVFHHESEQN